MYRTNSIVLFRNVNFSGSSDVPSDVSNARQFILFMIMKLGIVVGVVDEDHCFQHELLQVLYFSYESNPVCWTLLCHAI